MVGIRYISDIINMHRSIIIELLIYTYIKGGPKCLVSGISGCPDMFVSIRNFVVSVRRTGTLQMTCFYFKNSFE